MYFVLTSTMRILQNTNLTAFILLPDAHTFHQHSMEDSGFHNSLFNCTGHMPVNPNLPEGHLIT